MHTTELDIPLGRGSLSAQHAILQTMNAACPGFTDELPVDEDTVLNYETDVHHLRKFVVREVAENIIDARATHISIECEFKDRRMFVRIEDNGNGKKAVETEDKKGNNAYFGGRGKGENKMRKLLPKRPIFSKKKTIRNFFDVPDRTRPGYHRFSREDGSSTIFRLS